MKALLRALVPVLLAASSCTPTPTDTPPGEEARSTLDRITVAAPPAQLTQTVRSLNDFSFSLHRRLAGTENFVSAPISITTALAMTSAGAAGETLDGFRQALRVQGAQDDFHLAMNTLDRALASRGQGAAGLDGKPFTLRVTNQLFAQQDYPLEQPFLDLLAQQYGAGLRLLDFVKDTEGSRQAINGYVDHVTEHLVPALLPPASVTTDTRVVLANAVYFNAAWSTQFEAGATSPAPFTKDDGTTVQTAFMRHADVAARTALVNGVEAVELPYDGGEVSMLLLMPARGQLASFEAGLDGAALEQVVAALAEERLQLALPKFSVKSPTNLNAALAAEGLALAFDGATADFSALTRRAISDGLHITDVLHEAVIHVAEGGTEASGATAVIIGIESAANPARTLTVDRPFVFVVRDRATGAVLFLGHVVDPR